MHLKLRAVLNGEHVHVRVYVGPDADHLAQAGNLIMHIGEWQTFAAAFLLAKDIMGTHLNVVLEGYLAERSVPA